MSESLEQEIREIKKTVDRMDTFMFESKTGLKDIVLDIRSQIWGSTEKNNPGLIKRVTDIEDVHKDEEQVREKRTRRIYYIATGIATLVGSVLALVGPAVLRHLGW